MISGPTIDPGFIPHPLPNHRSSPAGLFTRSLGRPDPRKTAIHLFRSRISPLWIARYRNDSPFDLPCRTTTHRGNLISSDGDLIDDYTITKPRVAATRRLRNTRLIYVYKKGRRVPFDLLLQTRRRLRKKGVTNGEKLREHATIA